MARSIAYQLCFYVPQTHVEVVKAALFEAGAGRLGDYDRCAWQVLGEGQYRPLEGSQPFLGKQQQLQHVAEYKVEMLCAGESLAAVIAALKASHPYQTPAYHCFPVVMAAADSDS